MDVDALSHQIWGPLSSLSGPFEFFTNLLQQSFVFRRQKTFPTKPNKKTPMPLSQSIGILRLGISCEILHAPPPVEGFSGGVIGPARSQEDGDLSDLLGKAKVL